MNNKIDKLKKRLIYRSQYRGTKEMDKLIGGFVQSNIDNLSITGLKELETFLNIDDDTLYKFYTNQTIDQNLEENDILELFKKFNYKN
tara:strand:+ start:335 stop:598 length:264 start_codon:yes stop_codon:yes gene_type:complete